MSRSFDGDLANYLSRAIAVDIDQSFTLAVFNKPTSVATDPVPVMLADNAQPNGPRVGFQLRTVANGGPRVVVGYTSAGTAVVHWPILAAAEPSTSAWELSVFAFQNNQGGSDDAPTYYYNSASVLDTKVGVWSPAGVMDLLTVGQTADSTPGAAMTGLVSNVMLWQGIALAPADVQALLDATDIAALNAVQNANLSLHYPLDGANLADLQGGADLTVVGTVPQSGDDPLPTGSAGPTVTGSVAPDAPSVGATLDRIKAPLAASVVAAAPAIAAVLATGRKTIRGTASNLQQLYEDATTPHASRTLNYRFYDAAGLNGLVDANLRSSGQFTTDAAGNWSIDVADSAIAVGADGTLLVQRDDDPTLKGWLQIPVEFV